MVPKFNVAQMVISIDLDVSSLRNYLSAQTVGVTQNSRGTLWEMTLFG